MQPYRTRAMHTQIEDARQEQAMLVAHRVAEENRLHRARFFVLGLGAADVIEGEEDVMLVLQIYGDLDFHFFIEIWRPASITTKWFYSHHESKMLFPSFNRAHTETCKSSVLSVAPTGQYT